MTFKNLNTKRFNDVLIILCCTICIISIISILLPILLYSFLSIPYADDFSYTSNIREAMAEYGGVLKGLIARIWYEYITLEGGMYKVFCMTAGQLPFLKFNLPGLRIYIFICHLAFYSVLFMTINVLIKRCVKTYAHIVTLIIYTILIFWITNNQMNHEMYTWALIQSAYVIPIITSLLGIGLYLKHIDLPQQSRFRFICIFFSSLCGFLASGAPLNIVVLNCGLYFIVFFYAVRQAQLKQNEWIALGFTILGALINLLAPGNSARHGTEWGGSLFFQTFIVAFKHVLLKAGLFMSHTPFLLLCILLFIVFYKTVNYDYEKKITYDHPILFGMFCVAGIVFVDWPYTFGNSIVETRTFVGRVDFVSDISLYIVTIVWLLYFTGYIKKRIFTIKLSQSYYILFTIIGILLFCSVLIILSNGLFNYTTPYMISSLCDGSAKKYSNYQERIIDEIENTEDDVLIKYDCSIVPKKHPIIVGLSLCDNPDDAGLFWQNHAVARYYSKSLVYIEYLY